MSIIETCTIILPLPPGVLSPNRPPGSRGGRIKRAMVSKKYRRLAKEAALAVNIESGPWEKASATATFFHQTERRRDDVNHLAMLKPAYDGIVDAGIIRDDDSMHLSTRTPVFKIDKKFPRVEITIERGNC